MGRPAAGAFARCAACGRRRRCDHGSRVRRGSRDLVRRRTRLTADNARLAVSRLGPPPNAPASVPGSDYAELSRTVKRADLLQRRTAYYSIKIGANLLLLAAGWTVFAMLGQTWWQLLVAVFLGIMFTQTGFIGHDAGHRQISGSKRADDLIGRVHGNLLIGLSYGWWVSKHSRHHRSEERRGGEEGR